MYCMNTEYYRPFPSYLKPLKARQSAKPLIPKQFFILVEIKLISQERFGTYARFESDSFGTRSWPIES